MGLVVGGTHRRSQAVWPAPAPARNASSSRLYGVTRVRVVALTSPRNTLFLHSTPLHAAGSQCAGPLQRVASQHLMTIPHKGRVVPTPMSTPPCDSSRRKHQAYALPIPRSRWAARHDVSHTFLCRGPSTPPGPEGTPRRRQNGSQGAPTSCRGGGTWRGLRSALITPPLKIPIVWITCHYGSGETRVGVTVRGVSPGRIYAARTHQLRFMPGAQDQHP